MIELCKQFRVHKQLMQLMKNSDTSLLGTCCQFHSPQSQEEPKKNIVKSEIQLRRRERSLSRPASENCGDHQQKGE